MQLYVDFQIYINGDYFIDVKYLSYYFNKNFLNCDLDNDNNC